MLWPVPESRVVDERSIIGGHVVIPAPRIALKLQEVELDLDHLARGGGDHPGAVGVVEIGIRMDRRPDIINTHYLTYQVTELPKSQSSEIQSKSLKVKSK